MESTKLATAPARSQTATAAAAKSPAAVRGRLADLFDRQNLLWMAGGAALLVIGFFLMAGGGSSDPNVFDPAEVYSPRRITVAPILIIAGLVVFIVSIFRTPQKTVVPELTLDVPAK